MQDELDNLELIKPLLLFDSDDDMYYLQVLQRKKENPDIGANSKVIKNYYIRNLEYLDTKYDEIKKLCQFFNARAMIRLNRRSVEKVAFKTMVNLANVMLNKDYYYARTVYDKALGQNANEPNKKWIIDIDAPEIPENLIEELGENYICTIPSLNGFHIIVSPFDTREFKTKYDIDFHKDNPTNLYIPKVNQ